MVEMVAESDQKILKISEGTVFEKNVVDYINLFFHCLDALGYST